MPTGSSGSVRIFSRRSSPEEVVAGLRARVPRLAAALPLRRVVLFGSWATGRATAASDVDLLVVYDDPPRPDAFRLVHLSLAWPRLEPHVYAAGEAVAIEPTLARMARGGIELWPVGAAPGAGTARPQE